MPKTPLDHALDLLVYAPLGVVFTAREALPELIDKGRGRVTDQVTTARVMGRLAVSQGQKEAEKAVTQATQRLAGLGLVPRPQPASPYAGAETTSDPPGEAATPMPPDGPKAATAAPPRPAVSDDDLAIPGYAALSAPQVVQRLAGLSTEELEAVRSYEAATRHRKTILTRISQLQSPQH